MVVKNDTFWHTPLRIPRGTNPRDVYQIFNNTDNYKKHLFGIYFTYISI